MARLRSVPDSDLHLCSVTIGELQVSVKINRDQDPERAAEIEAWWNRLPRPITQGVSMAVPAALIEDAMIAATAEVHNRTVVTRNVRDFERLGVRTLNPFKNPAA